MTGTVTLSTWVYGLTLGVLAWSSAVNLWCGFVIWRMQREQRGKAL